MMKKIIAKRLFDGKKILENAVVIFDEKEIKYVGTDNKEKVKETLKAEFVTPGFVDLSSGIGLKEESMPDVEGNDFDEETNPATPELLALDGINPFDDAFPKALRGGVLETLVLPGISNPVGGRGAFIYTKGRTVEEMLIKSPCGVRFSLNNAPKTVYGKQRKMPMTRMGSAYIVRNALYKTKEYMNKKEKKFSLSEESLIPLLKGKEKAFFAAFRADDIATSIRISKEFGIKSVVTFASEADIVIDLLKESKIPVVFGPVILPRFDSELKHHTPKVPAELIEKGVKTAIMSGHPFYPAEYLRIQLGPIIAEGIKPVDALKSVTSVPAEILGIKGYGILKKGAKLSIVMFDGEPWETKTKVVKVFI
jgi:imidazolonepropionase-like amidohydrolase